MSSFAIALLVLYFLPTLLAALRRSKRGWGVMVINVFLGWTFIGWVVALAWAVSSDRQERPTKPHRSFRLS